MTSIFAPLGNLKRIGEKGVRIELKKLDKLLKTEYLARKNSSEPLKILIKKIKTGVLSSYYRRIAKKAIKIIEENS